MSIKPIETKYKGYRFRSRLEARWAVFFDALGIKWEYEHEGYILDDNTWYLPDFYLPDWDTYIEIKAKMPTQEELDKIIKMAKVEDKKIKPSYIAIGTPGVPKLGISNNRKNGFQYHVSDGSILLSCGSPFIVINAFSYINIKSEPEVDISYLYGGIDFLNPTRPSVHLEYEILPNEINDEEVNEFKTGKFNYAALIYPIVGMGLPTLYQGDGRSFIYPTLLKAYEAARSARFEFGESGV